MPARTSRVSSSPDADVGPAPAERERRGSIDTSPDATAIVGHVARARRCAEGGADVNRGDRPRPVDALVGDDAAAPRDGSTPPSTSLPPGDGVRAAVVLTAPGLLPRNANTLAYRFGSELREAAKPLRDAFLAQLPVDSPLREAPSLEAWASIAFGDRRHRAAHNLEPVLLAGLEAALEAAGWRVRTVDLTVQLRQAAKQPGTTVELEGSR